VVAELDKAKLTYTLSSSGRRALFCRDYDGNTLELIEKQFKD
jgi:glyoxylase I family protein